MANKPTERQAHIKAYINSTEEQKKLVKNVLDKYMISSDNTLGSIAQNISNILNTSYDRKKVASLLLWLKYPKRDKAIEQASRTKGIRSQRSAQSNQYVLDQINILEKAGTSVDTFKQEWANNSYLYFKKKYGMSQYNVDVIVKYLHIERKLIKDYNDIINELKEYNFGYSEIYHFYIVEKNDKASLEKLLSRIVGWNIGDKRLDNVLKELNIKKNKRDLDFARSQGDRALKAANMKKLNRAGYTLESLAKFYEENKDVTKSELVRELNKTITKNDQPFTERWLHRYLDPLLTDVRKGNVSREELNFRKYFLQRFPEFTNMLDYNRRDIISPQELDIYIPSKRVAIEFNGDFWHSDKYMTINHDMTAREYHESKQTECAKHNIQLFFVWETDWNERHEEVLDAFQEYFNSGNILPIISTIDK